MPFAGKADINRQDNTQKGFLAEAFTVLKRTVYEYVLAFVLLKLYFISINMLLLQ